VQWFGIPNVELRDWRERFNAMRLKNDDSSSPTVAACLSKESHRT